MGREQGPDPGQSNPESWPLFSTANSQEAREMTGFMPEVRYFELLTIFNKLRHMT